MGSPGYSTGHPFHPPANCSSCDTHPTSSRSHHGNLLLESGGGDCFGGFPGDRILYYGELEMHKFGFQLCPLISRDPKHVIYSLQVVIRLSVLVAEVASGEWGAGSEKKKGGKKKSSEMDDGQPDGRMLSRGLPFSWNPPGAACPVQLFGSPSSPSCGHFNTGGMSGFNVRSISK
ncbi:RIKEN cDNA E130018O15 [Mus musculus]|nr:RIKEN cDNA E130018O15 [Mus musculus]